MDEAPDEAEQPSRRTNPRAAWVFAIAVVVVAAVLIGLLMSGGDPACDEWEDAKAAWVESYPPIQRETKSDLADFQGWVEINGARVERPEGC